jgi:lipoprotein NlpI
VAIWRVLMRAFFVLAVVIAAPSFAAPGQESLAQAKQSMRAGFQSGVEGATREIESGQMHGSRLAEAYRTRGVNQSHLLAYDKAIEDFSKAIELDGFNPQYYQDRAIAYLRAREFSKADTDLEMVLGLDRSNFSALREKGRTAFYRGDYGPAEGFFLQASRSADREGMVYSMLWVSLAAQRAGKPSPLNITVPSGQDRSQWPVPVAELLKGSISPEQYLALADATNPRAYLMLQCEAQFYLGQYYLTKGEKDLARRSFSAAVLTGVTDFMEYDWALRELEVLAGTAS